MHLWETLGTCGKLGIQNEKARLVGPAFFFLVLAARWPHRVRCLSRRGLRFRSVSLNLRRHPVGGPFLLGVLKICILLFLVTQKTHGFVRFIFARTTPDPCFRLCFVKQESACFCRDMR